MFLKTLVVMGVFAAVITGCASNTSKLDEDPVAALANRANTYYKALVARDYKTTYELHPPSYRAQYSYESHIIKGVHWVTYVAARVVNVSCAQENTCNVEVELEYTGVVQDRGQVKGVVKTLVSQRWGRVDGAWYMCENVSCK